MPTTRTQNAVAVATVGVARKVIAAVSAQAVALIVNLIATGSFDKVEFAQLVGIGLTIVFGAVAGPGGTGGQVEVERR